MERKGLKFTTHRRDFLTYGDLIFRPGTSALCSLVYPGDVMVVISENSEGNPFTSILLLSEIRPIFGNEKKRLRDGVFRDLGRHDLGKLRVEGPTTTAKNGCGQVRDEHLGFGGFPVTQDTWTEPVLWRRSLV